MQPSENGVTIATRLLWPGIGRMALEEAARVPADLVVYRQETTREVYDSSTTRVKYLRSAGASGPLTPLLQRATMLFNSDRGLDSTVDLDLILEAARRLSGVVLYHDQFAGLTGFIRRALFGDDYALYVHETVLGEGKGVMDLTLRSPALAIPLRTYDRNIIGRARVVFTNSVANQSVLAAEGVRARVAYPGCRPVENPSFERDPFILAVAVWERTKKPEIYSQLALRSGVRVVMAGMWGRQEEMEQFRREAPPSVRVTGPIPESALDELSRTASLYARFGYGERGPGQGGIQALGYGIPVMANSGLAMSELIEDGENGFVVGDLEDAVGRVEELFSSPSRMRRMSERAWLSAKMLTWDEHANRIREGLSVLR
jgi:glycosyltransferase involved in cell wall biosynthesis